MDARETMGDEEGVYLVRGSGRVDLRGPTILLLQIFERLDAEVHRLREERRNRRYEGLL